jgi:taurine dioxygenase
MPLEQGFPRSGQPGDVAFWDNRSTQHRVHNDFGEARRRIHRVTVTGEIPV